MSRPPLSDEELRKRLRALERLALLMDDAIKIPGTKFRVGWDSLLGIIPGAGDLTSVLTHSYLIWQGYQMGIRKRVHARMLFNAFIDVVGGAPPLIGDLFDIIWKSNRMNVDLLRDELKRQREGND